MSLILKVDAQKFRRKLLDKISYNYRKAYPQIKKAIRGFVADELNQAYFAHPTVKSIEGGDLRAEFGLQFAQVKARAIYEALLKSLRVNLSSNKKDSLLNIRIEMARSDFQDILNLSEAYQTWTDAGGDTVKGEPLPWLEWLLLEGDSLVIADYRFSTAQLGRSNLPGIMVAGRGWRVPTEHSGTYQSNFITEILDKVGGEVDKKLWRIVRPVLTRTF